MKHQAYFLRILLPVLAVTSLIGLAWGYQSIQSALAQHTDSIPPVAYAGPDQAVHPGSAVTLDGSGSYDPDNELPLSYLWAQTGGPAVTFTPTLSVTAFSAPAVPTVLTFTLVVTDSDGMPDPTPDDVVIRALGQPIANDDRGAGFITDEDTPFITADVLANDTDPIGSPLWVQSFDTSETLGQVSMAEPAGSLDTVGFGSPEGFLSVDFGGSDSYCRTVAVQPDGKSLVGGFMNTAGHNYFALARYNPDGTLDTSFGSSGVVTTSFNGLDDGWKVAIQTDGKIVFGGLTTNIHTEIREFAVARYTPDGSLDTYFGSGGKVTTSFGNEYTDVYGLTIQPDGKIIVVGDTATAFPNYDFALVRYNPNGSLDTTFGNGGKLTTDFNSWDEAYAVAVQPDGLIVAIGTSNANFALARYYPDGSLDASFGSGGKVTTNFGVNAYGRAMIILPNGKIVMTGYTYNGSTGDIALARYIPNGILDPTFGFGGKLLTDFGGFEYGSDITLQPDGKFIVAGTTDYGTVAEFTLARYLPDGSLDPAFGAGGKTITDFGGDNYGSAVALQEDGNILMSGENILARFTGKNPGFFTYNPIGPFDYLRAGEVATDTYSYFVTNGVLTDTAVVSITVIGINYPPAANAGSDQNVAVLATVTLNGSGSIDPDGDLPLSYFWAQTGGPAVAFNPILSVTTFTAPSVPTVLTFTLTVTDHAGLADPTPDETVIQVYGQPVAHDDSGTGFITDANTAFLTADTLNNDVDPGGSPLSVQSYDTSETRGLVTFNNGGGATPGSLDINGFGAPNGYVTIDFGGYDENSIQGVAIQTDGKIIASGSAYMGGGENDFALARFNSDGSLDNDFGDNGVVTTDFEGDYDRGMGVVIQQDQKIVMAGYEYNSVTYNNFALARYNPDGSLDATFGNNGKVTLDYHHADNELYAIAIQPDGKIIAGGFIVNTNYDFAVVRYNQNGSLDTTFGNNGLAITDFGGYEAIDAIAIQSNGKIVAVGYSDDGYTIKFALAAYNPDGSADIDFGNNGEMTTSFYGINDEPYSIAIQPDGKIIVAGVAYNGNNGDVALARYTSNGSLDTSFGTNGQVTTDINNQNEGAFAVTIQTDGKIIAAGDTGYGSYDAMMVRYNQVGELDPVFGINGIAITDFGDNDFAGTVALQSDGKIVTAGSNILARYYGNTNSGVFYYDPNGKFSFLAPGETATDSFTYIVTNGVLTDTAVVSITIVGFDNPPIAVGDSGPAFATDEDIPFVTGDVLANDSDPEGQPLSVQSFNTTATRGLVTFNGGGGAPPGSLDEAFGNTGIVTTDFANTYDESYVVTVQPDRKIILAGVTIGTNGGDFALARYHPDGSLDDSFGTGGKVTTDFGNEDTIRDLAIRPDGKIVVVAEMTNGSNDDFALVQYNPDGSLDTTFGNGGLVMTDFGQQDHSMAIAIHDNKIVVVGETMGLMGDNCDFALARYNLDGNLDITFGNDGLVTTDFAGGPDSGQSVAIQANGLILAAGSVDDINSEYNFGLARYNPDGTLDPTFGNEGLVITDLGSSDGIVGLAIQSNGQIVAGGFTLIDSITVFALARYNIDGSLDNEYGDNGIATVNLGNNSPRAMAIQSDVKIVMSASDLLARFLGGGNTGRFNYDPNGQFEYLAAGEIATDTFTYVVSDGVLTDTATVSITITGVNDPPSFNSTPITTAVTTLPYTYTIITTDPDASDLLTITAPALPEWLTLTDHGDRSATLHGTPPDPGSYPIILQVTDGLANATQAFTITVSPSPANPVADLSVTQAFQWTSSSSGVFTLTVTNLGPDGAPGAVVSDTFPASFASVTWTCVGSGGATCSSNRSGNIADILASFPAGGVVTYTVTVGNIFFGSWMNAAEVVTPSGISDPVPANNRSTFRFDIVQIFLPVIVR